MRKWKFCIHSSSFQLVLLLYFCFERFGKNENASIYSDFFNWEINQRVLDSERKQTTYTPSQHQNEKIKPARCWICGRNYKNDIFFSRICIYLVLVYPPCVGLANGYIARCRESVFLPIQATGLMVRIFPVTCDPYSVTTAHYSYIKLTSAMIRRCVAHETFFGKEERSD